MKHYLQLILLTTLIPLAGISQPTVTKSWLGSEGDIVTSREAQDIPDISPSGTDATWDFSDIVPGDTVIIAQLYVKADTTALIGQFPNANICLFAQETDPEYGLTKAYQYSRATDNLWENLGLAVSSEQLGVITLKYSNPQTLLTFPFTYQSSASDDYSSIFDIGIVKVYGQGTTNFSGDAWGTVMLPNGTFNNCIRIKYVDESVDSTDLGLGIVEKAHSKNTTYIWLSSEHPGPLASYTATESFSVALVPPLPPDTTETEFDTTFSWDQTAVSSSVEYFQPTAFEFLATPNPFTSEINLNYTLEAPEQLTFEIQSLDGRSVYRRTVPGTAGQNTENISINHIPPGTYIAILFGDKQAAVQKIIKSQ